MVKKSLAFLIKQGEISITNGERAAELEDAGFGAVGGRRVDIEVGIHCTLLRWLLYSALYIITLRPYKPCLPHAVYYA